MAKKSTKIGGVHIMQIFTNTMPASPDIASFAIGLAEKGKLFALYDDRRYKLWAKVGDFGFTEFCK